MARIDEEGESRGGMEMTGFQLPAFARTGPAGMTEPPIWNSRYGNVFRGNRHGTGEKTRLNLHVPACVFLWNEASFSGRFASI